VIWALDRACEGDAAVRALGRDDPERHADGQLLQVRRAHDIFLRQLAAIHARAADLADTTKDMLLPGRTHGQHAVPATSAQGRGVDRRARPPCERLRGLRGARVRGHAGRRRRTLASLGEPGLATQEKMAARLASAIRCPRAPSRSPGRVVLLLACSPPPAARSAARSTPLMKQGVRRARGAGAARHRRQQHHAQKRNPKLSQDIIAAAAQIRALAPLALEAMQTEHEADRNHSIMMGRALVDRPCELTRRTCSRGAM